jgi:hypothetical protein
MLDCPLPIDGLVDLTDFLEATEWSTQSFGKDEDKKPPSSSTNTAVSTDLVTEINKVLAMCETQLLLVENQNYLAEKLAETSHRSSSVNLSEIPLEISISTSVSSQYQEAMHAALMKVMQERDQAHARMVAANVLHVHEMEQQRKKTAQLASQLEVAKNSITSTTPGGQSTKDSSELRRIERQMQQNSDAELLALCQQLASEISGRTEAALEVSRLKESRQIERENEIAEKKALRDEMDHLKELLAQERKKAEAARQESGSWKESFREVVQAKERSIH